MDTLVGMATKILLKFTYSNFVEFIKNEYKTLTSKCNKVCKWLPVLIKVSLLLNLMTLSSILKSQDNDNQENNENWILSLGYSKGLFNGETFSNYPSTFSIYFNPPVGFDLGALYYDISIVYGNFNGEYSRPQWQNILAQEIEEPNKFNVPFFMIGGSMNFIDDFFTEGQIGLLGKGFGFRGFMGLDIPGNIPDYELKIGSEFFLGNALSEPGNVSYIGTIFIRVELFLNRIKFASSF